MKSSTYIRTHDNIHNTYLKNYFFFFYIYARNIYHWIKIVYRTKIEIFIHIFPSLGASIHREGLETKSEFPLRFFPPVHFQSETDFVRQVSSCMLRCATSRVTRRRKLELWKFRRASTPLSLSLSRIRPLKFRAPSLAIDITFARGSKTSSSFMIHRHLQQWRHSPI